MCISETHQTKQNQRREREREIRTHKVVVKALEGLGHPLSLKLLTTNCHNNNNNHLTKWMIIWARTNHIRIELERDEDLRSSRGREGEGWEVGKPLLL